MGRTVHSAQGTNGPGSAKAVWNREFSVVSSLVDHLIQVNLVAPLECRDSILSVYKVHQSLLIKQLNLR